MRKYKCITPSWEINLVSIFLSLSLSLSLSLFYGTQFIITVFTTTSPFRVTSHVNYVPISPISLRSPSILSSNYASVFQVIFMLEISILHFFTLLIWSVPAGWFAHLSLFTSVALIVLQGTDCVRETATNLQSDTSLQFRRSQILLSLYLARSRNYKAPHYAIVFILLLPSS
jgi:hypothetical protein